IPWLSPPPPIDWPRGRPPERVGAVCGAGGDVFAAFGNPLGFALSGDSASVRAGISALDGAGVVGVVLLGEPGCVGDVDGGVVRRERVGDVDHGLFGPFVGLVAYHVVLRPAGGDVDHGEGGALSGGGDVVTSLGNPLGIH